MLHYTLRTHLSTKVAGVLGVLANFNLLYHLPERGTITSTILSSYSDLLGSFRLEGRCQHQNEHLINQCFS